MMKKCFLIAMLLTMFICLTPDAGAQQRTKNAEPTLDLTLGWIKEKINLYHDVSIANAGGSASTETYEVTRADGCSLEIRHIEAEEGLKVTTVYQLPLLDYAEFDASNCQMFTIHTQGSSVPYIQSIEGRENKRENSNGVTDHVVVFTRRLDVDNCDLQKRLKKAFDHAAELCKAADQKDKKDQAEQKEQKRQKRRK